MPSLRPTNCVQDIHGVETTVSVTSRLDRCMYRTSESRGVHLLNPMQHTTRPVLSIITVLAIFVLACGSDSGNGEPDDVIIGSGEIETSGGVIRSESGDLELQIPAGALQETTEISIDVVSNDDVPEDVRNSGGSGPAWKLEPSGLTFDQPITVSVELAGSVDQDSEGLISVPSGLFFTVSEDGTAEFLEDSSVSVSEDGKLIATASLSHFSWLVFHESVMEVRLEQIDPIDQEIGSTFEVRYEISSEAPVKASLESILMTFVAASENEFVIDALSPLSTNNLSYVRGRSSRVQRGFDDPGVEKGVDISIGDGLDISFIYGEKETGTFEFKCESAGPAEYGLVVLARPFKELVPKGREDPISKLWFVQQALQPPKLELEATGDVNCVGAATPTLPPTTAGELGDEDSVEVVILDGNSYPLVQFGLESVGGATIMTGRPDQIIFSFEEPQRGLVDFGELGIDIGGITGREVREVEVKRIPIPRHLLGGLCGEVEEQTSADIAHYSPIRDFCGELIEPNPAPARPTATPATRGVRVQVVKIGDAHYYRYVMEPTGNRQEYNCGDNDYGMHISPPYTEIRSFEYPKEALPNPDPTGCGFGPSTQFSVDGIVIRERGAIALEYIDARFTAKVIGEWCREMGWKTKPQVPQVERLCTQNPPQD